MYHNDWTYSLKWGPKPLEALQIAEKIHVRGARYATKAIPVPDIQLHTNTTDIGMPKTPILHPTHETSFHD